MSLKKVFTLIERNMRVKGQRIVRAEAIVRFYKRYPELIDSDQTIMAIYPTYRFGSRAITHHIYRHRADNINDVIDELGWIVRNAHKDGRLWFPTQLMYPTYLRNIPVFHSHYSLVDPIQSMNENI